MESSQESWNQAKIPQRFGITSTKICSAGPLGAYCHVSTINTHPQVSGTVRQEMLTNQSEFVKLYQFPVVHACELFQTLFARALIIDNALREKGSGHARLAHTLNTNSNDNVQYRLLWLKYTCLSTPCTLSLLFCANHSFNMPPAIISSLHQYNIIRTINEWNNLASIRYS